MIEPTSTSLHDLITRVPFHSDGHYSFCISGIVVSKKHAKEQ